MLLVIHNLPPNTRYADVKALIKDKCGLTEMIVDNLVAEGKNKKVTVGLADEGDAAILVRKINGLYVCNQQLYVEDVRQKKTAEQPYRPRSMSSQYNQEQYNECPQPQFENQFYGQPDVMQFQPPPLMSMETQLSSCLPAPNFGIPFYMTAQNQNVGNNLQFMVQYPKVQGSMGNESYEGQDMGFDQPHGGRKGDQSMSSDRGPHRELSPKHLSRWNESDCDRSDGRRGRNRSTQRDDRHDAEQSYNDKSYRDSFQNRSNQDYGSNKQNNNRFDKPYSRSEPNWERLNRSTFGEQNESHRFNDNRNVNVQGHRYNQEKEPQRFRENNYSQSRGSDYTSRRDDFSKKRPYESSDINKFGPQNKKFGGNQQFNSRNQQGASGSSFSNNYQNKKNPYLNKSPARASMQQNRPHVQPKGPQMQPKGPQMQSKGPKMQPKGPQMQPKLLQKNKPQWQPKSLPMKHLKKQANFAKDRPVSKEFKKPTEEMLARHEAWRVQAAAVIATQILTNVGRMCNKRDPFLLKLKTFVRARIDVITGDDMSFNLRDMLSNYREKFQDDDVFYNAVLEKMNNSVQDDFETQKKGSEGGEVGDKKKSDIKPKLQFIGKPPAKVSSAGDLQRLPKYPDGDKKVLSQMKQAQKHEMINESLYTLDEVHEKALDEELDKIGELIKQELENPVNETEKSLSKFMNDVFVPDVRKVLTLHVKKRILDVRTNLSIRVICHYKAPKRHLLDAFLKDYGVVSLKASDKNRNVFVAICNSYESFDALCKENSTIIDNLKVSFRPLHITGPPIKTKFKKQVGNFTKGATTESNNVKDVAATFENKSGNDKKETNDGNDKHSVKLEENMGKIHSDVKETQVNEDFVCEIIPSNNSEDVIVIEEDKVFKSKHVIVIDENDDKVTIHDKQVIVLDKALAPVEHSEIVTVDGKGFTINKESVTVCDEGKTIYDNKGAVINNSKIMEREEPQIIDNDNIVDDDLEDF